MNYEEFMKLKKPSFFSLIKDKLNSMSERQVVEFDLSGKNKKTFMVYIERMNAQNKPEKHWSYAIEKGIAYVARNK